MLYPYIQEAGLLWMFPIIFLSFCTLALALERCYYWFMFYMKALDREHKLKQIFARPFRSDVALGVCKTSQDKVLLILADFLTKYNNLPLTIAERKAQMLAEAQVEDSRTSLDILALVVSISGTLGLIGTVVGISLSFKTLANEDSKGLALALSTAMYTTIGGMILFLISYLFLFLFQKLSNKFESSIDTNIQQIYDILEINEKSEMIFEKKKEQSKMIFAETEESAKPSQKDENADSVISKSNPILEKKNAS